MANLPEIGKVHEVGGDPPYMDLQEFDLSAYPGIGTPYQVTNGRALRLAFQDWHDLPWEEAHSQGTFRHVFDPTMGFCDQRVCPGPPHTTPQISVYLAAGCRLWTSFGYRTTIYSLSTCNFWSTQSNVVF